MKNVVLSLFASFLLLGETHSTDGVSINYSDRPFLTEEMRSTLAATRPIKRCMLDQTPLTGADLTLISKIENLKSLSVVGCGLWKNSLSYLSIPSLEELYISHNEISLPDLKSLTWASNLIVFHCWGISIGDEGVQYLVSAMPKLKQANVAGCGLSDASLKYVLMFPDIKKVVLSQNAFSKHALTAFQEQAQLRSIEVVL